MPRERQHGELAMIAAGTKLGVYELIAPLGSGGMGEVYRARDNRLGREVALKLLSSRLTEDHAAVERFTREARAVSALNHPHIVTIHDTGESEAGRFIVMELVDGRTLRAILGESVSLDALVSWGGQIAKALEVAHAAGITHRDIKPENIMVRADGYVKVLDFGLARLIPISSDMEAGTLANTTPGTLLGTVRYMSPEQARGEIVTNATDIFALGIVLYELATGRHPFAATSMLGVLHAIIAERPLAPSRLHPEPPAALDALIRQMLEKDARLRPRASEVAAALSEIKRASERASGRQSPSASVSPALRLAHYHARSIVGRERSARNCTPASPR